MYPCGARRLKPHAGAQSRKHAAIATALHGVSRIALLGCCRDLLHEPHQLGAIQPARCADSGA